MRSDQLSMSIARANAATTIAARTNHAADSPRTLPAMPAMKNAATPSCAMASAAALRTDMNGRSAVDDRTTRIGRRGRMGENGVIERIRPARSAPGLGEAVPPEQRVELAARHAEQPG